MRGSGATSLVVVLLFVLLVVGFLLTMGTAYVQYWTVRSIMSDVASSPGVAMRPGSLILLDIDRRLEVNSIRSDVSRANFSFHEDARGRHLTVRYEVRRGFVANLDLVARFENSVLLAR
jgi:hypothetical protein